MRRSGGGRCLRAVAACLVAVGLAGCGTRPCKDGTALVTVDLDAASSAADTLAVQLDLDGAKDSGTVPHTPGSTSGEIAIQFSQPYAVGKHLTATVTAVASGRTLGAGTGSVVLGGSCATLSVQVIAGANGDGSSTGDMAATHDMPATPDLVTAPDFASPPDLQNPDSALFMDLAMNPDLAISADFESPADFTPNEDFAMQPDFATPPDLATPPDFLPPPDLVPLPAHCSDGIRNSTETAIDCGGSCPACANGSTCVANADCLSGTCTRGVCAPASCVDGQLSAGETAVDCGGPCPGCANGQPCSSSMDCGSLNCVGGACAAYAAASFNTTTSVTVGANPSGFSFADLDHDGKTDVAVALSGAVALGVMWNGGSRTFTPATFPAPSGPDDVGIGDFNLDGKYDAVTSNGSGSVPNFSLYAGLAGRQFAGATNTPAAAQAFCGVVGDFNRDGLPDVALGLWSKEMQVFINRGDGTFNTPSNYTTTGFNAQIATGDLNRDGNLDLITGATYMDTSINVFLGNGDGTFRAGVRYVGDSVAVATGDFNGDGKLDVISGSAATALVFLGNGDGTLQTARTISGPSSMRWVAVADFNHDGLSDAVVANSSSVQLTLLMATGGGAMTSSGLATTGSCGSVGAFDVDGDGKADILCGHNAGSSIVDVLFNTSQ